MRCDRLVANGSLEQGISGRLDSFATGVWGGFFGGGLVAEDVGESAGRGGIGNESAEPLQEGGAAVLGRTQPVGMLAQNFDALLEDGFEKGPTGGEVAAYGRRSDACGPGDPLLGCVGTVRGDLGFGDSEDPSVIASGV
jgi:hypothetical protein